MKKSFVPAIEGLTIEELVKYAGRVEKVKNYVPDLKDWVHVDRKWLCDIIYTLDTENFQRHIDECLKKKRKCNEEKKNTMVGIRAEFVAALSKSVVFSSKQTHPGTAGCHLCYFCDSLLLTLIPIDSKGRAASFIAKGGKKRTRAEFEEIHGEQLELQEDKVGFLKRFKRMREEHTEMHNLLLTLNPPQNLLQQFAKAADSNGQAVQQQQNKAASQLGVDNAGAKLPNFASPEPNIVQNEEDLEDEMRLGE